MRILLLLSLTSTVLCSPPGAGRQADRSAAVLTTRPGVRLLAAEAAGGGVAHPENVLDGDPATAFTFEWANGGAALVIDLAGPCVVEAVRVTNAQSNRVVWVREIAIGPDADHLRKLLGRQINLPMWRGGDSVRIPLPPSVGRVVRIEFAGGGKKGAVGEVAFFGRQNRPERHLMCWSGDLKRDYLDKLDYLDRDLGVTDLWVDYVETAFPQTNHNSGFQIWRDTGALGAFAKRGIRYWLAEHEAFTQMVNEPADLHDDLKWITTLRQARQVYAQARELGFRGLVFDAEDYGGVTAAAKEKYKDVADHVDAWTFADEFGLSGLYYHRGLQFGRVLATVWPCPLMQVYEARMYAGKGDCRAGNYWWLKGIHDAGIEIWIATERTYGAGKGEIDSEYPEWTRRWFVDMREYVAKAHRAYPFATRVLPGFAPWNTRLRKPNYLPKYLEEQLDIARRCALGYWIYNEGNARAGDPRDVLDRAFCKKYDTTPERYLEVFARHPTSRSGR